METAYRGTPTWLVAMLVVFGAAAAATFGLFLAKHAENRALEEQSSFLNTEIPRVRSQAQTLADSLLPLADQIRQRRERLNDASDGMIVTEKTALADAEKLVIDNQGAVTRANESYQKYLEATQGRDGAGGLFKDLRDRRAELAAAEEHSFTVEREQDTKRIVQREKVEKQQQDIEGIKKKNRGETVVLDSRVGELEDRVRRLTSQLDESQRNYTSDGVILASQARDGFVVIDRGHQQNLRQGTRFAVYNQRGGKVVVKGEIQVIKVEDTIATARVVSENDLNDPLLEGDHLHNPVYDPAKVIHFAIAGDFTEFSKDELARFVTESGGVVDKALSTSTDFLVAGAHADAAAEQAGKLGMVVLSETQLIEFVRPGARFTSARAFRYMDEAAKAKRAFALKGRFTLADEALVRDYLQRQGGTVQSSIEPGLAAVIVGEGAEDDMVKARELGVPVIDQLNFSHLSVARDVQNQKK